MASLVDPVVQLDPADLDVLVDPLGLEVRLALVALVELWGRVLVQMWVQLLVGALVERVWERAWERVWERVWGRVLVGALVELWGQAWAQVNRVGLNCPVNQVDPQHLDSLEGHQCLVGLAAGLLVTVMIILVGLADRVDQMDQ